ncbi:MAG: AIPR family protein [Croceibacterium sp.]
MNAQADWMVAYTALRDEFGLTDDAIGAFAVQLRFNLDDLKELAAESIVGGGDDKKCDVFYFDQENGIVVLAQCYMAQTQKTEAPANKASDLNTAVAWILNADLTKIPEALQDRAAELRKALAEDEVRQLHVWYVHNLPTSKNVANELETVATTAKVGIKQHTTLDNVEVYVKEIGCDELLKLYVQAERAIIVTDEFSVVVPSVVETNGPNWSSLSTFVLGDWLAQQFDKFKTDLFSANIRGYLGSREVDANINNGIKSTARDEPENFSIYNNGITALVLDYEVVKVETGSEIRLKGLSIVNGAQTTGSLANVGGKLGDKLLVPIRFVKSSSEDIVNKIVKYNNSQNKIEAADFRSGDQIQQRLREEFEIVPDADYEGGRRGGASDAIKRSKNTIPSYTIAQALAAFHGDPVTAYDRKSALWTGDKSYAEIFNEKKTARHMVLVYSLLQNLNARRLGLIECEKKDALTESDKKVLAFLNRKGATFLILFALSQVIETIVGKPVPNKFDLRFKDNLSPADAAKRWDPLLDIILPLNEFFTEAFSSGRIQGEGVQSAMPKFTGVFDGLKTIHKGAFDGFASVIATG